MLDYKRSIRLLKIGNPLVTILENEGFAVGYEELANIRSGKMPTEKK